MANGNNGNGFEDPTELVKRQKREEQIRQQGLSLGEQLAEDMIAGSKNGKGARSDVLDIGRSQTFKGLSQLSRRAEQGIGASARGLSRLGTPAAQALAGIGQLGRGAVDVAKKSLFVQPSGILRPGSPQVQSIRKIAEASKALEMRVKQSLSPVLNVNSIFSNQPLAPERKISSSHFFNSGQKRNIFFRF